jgi:hypothetical protein
MAAFTVTLNPLQERALTALTAEHNQGFPNAQITVEQFFQMRALEYLNVLVRRYKENVTGDLVQQFSAAAPDRQQKFLNGEITLTQLTGQTPIP